MRIVMSNVNITFLNFNLWIKHFQMYTCVTKINLYDLILTLHDEIVSQAKPFGVWAMNTECFIGLGAWNKISSPLYIQLFSISRVSWVSKNFYS